jgi:hypothetical protein
MTWFLRAGRVKTKAGEDYTRMVENTMHNFMTVPSSFYIPLGVFVPWW